MSAFFEMLKPDAFVSFSYEITDTSGTLTMAPTTPSEGGPFDWGEDPIGGTIAVGSAFIIATTNDGTLGLPVYDVKTIFYLVNLGHLLPMEWTIERKQYDDTETLIDTTSTTFLLTTSASHTFECTLPVGRAEFTATFKSPV